MEGEILVQLVVLDGMPLISRDPLYFNPDLAFCTEYGYAFSLNPTHNVILFILRCTASGWGLEVTPIY